MFAAAESRLVCQSLGMLVAVVFAGMLLLFVCYIIIISQTYHHWQKTWEHKVLMSLTLCLPEKIKLWCLSHTLLTCKAAAPHVCSRIDVGTAFDIAWEPVWSKQKATYKVNQEPLVQGSRDFLLSGSPCYI